MRVKELLTVIAEDVPVTIEGSDGFTVVYAPCERLRRAKLKELDAEVLMAYPAPVSSTTVMCEIMIKIAN